MSESPAPLLRALADPTRRTIFERLCRDGAQTVGVATALAGVSQPAVSKHLALLAAAGLVTNRRVGRTTVYEAQIDALKPLRDWTDQMQRFWEGRFGDLENVLKRMDQ